MQPQPLHPGINSGASLLFHLLFHFLLKRYAIVNNPAIANIASNAGTPFFSDAGIFVTVAAGDGVGTGVGGIGVTVGDGVEIGGVDVGVTDGEVIGVSVIDLLRASSRFS